MKITLRIAERSLDLDTEFDTATIAELAALALPGHGIAHGQAIVDGQPYPMETPLVDLPIGDGAVVDIGDRLSYADGGRSVVAAVEVVSGPGAGITVGLPAGRYRIGAGDEAELVLRAPGVAPHHADLAVSADGVLRLEQPDRAIDWGPGEMIRIGDCVLTTHPRRTDHAANVVPGRSGHGQVPFNRPPAHRTEPPDPTPIRLPLPARPPQPRHRLGLAALIVPLLVGGTLAVLVHPRMALFALLGPVMMGASWLDDRRLRRRLERQVRIETDDHVTEIEAQLRRHAAAERSRRHRRHPTSAGLVEHAGGSLRMWERRSGHLAFLHLVLGYGAAPWCPPIDGELVTAEPALAALVAQHQRLVGPAEIDLTPGHVLGVSGDDEGALDMVRGLLLEAAVMHGPADLGVAIVTNRPDRWDWAKWLPHTLADAAGRRLLAGDADEINQVATMILTRSEAGGGADRRPILMVVDGVRLEIRESEPLRRCLAEAAVVSGIVIAGNADALPAACQAVAHVQRPGLIRISGLEGTDELTLAGTGAHWSVAERGARRLARFVDPYSTTTGRVLPSTVRLAQLVDLHDPETLVARWAKRTIGPVPIGIGDAGPIVVDLVTDGPHALVAGTTGSGKSELLRTLVASLAAAAGPDALTFVLIDYKGGSAFDACADLPHTVGVVTDLDEHLAARALVCLEAELRHREQQLRKAGVDDIGRYQNVDDPLPRMAVVIDEFAALAAELPNFMDALVDIGARGRSLGIHLVLATQRPAGVVRDQLRANTNLRIALRVQDRHDSMDVLGDPRAADIGRHQPGRGWLRLGPGELANLQTAIVTSSGDEGAARVTIRPFRFGVDPVDTSGVRDVADGTDLVRFVQAARRASEHLGLAPPRRPWPDPLPEHLHADDLPPVDAAPGAVGIGLIDEPDLQRTRVMHWHPGDGSMIVYGTADSGCRTLLVRLATGLVDGALPASVHIYVLDQNGSDLAVLERFPHVGAVVSRHDHERRIRLLGMLDAELERRRTSPTHSHPSIVVLADDVASLLELVDLPGERWKDVVTRIVTDGPRVGISTVLTATRTSAVPSPVASAVAAKLSFRLADPLGASSLGLRRVLTDLPLGRAVDVATARDVQMVVTDLEVWQSEHPLLDEDAGHSGAPPVRTMPSTVQVAEIGDLTMIGDEWRVPVGVTETTLQTATVRLGNGDHLLVVGEPRSGRSSLLEAIGAAASRHHPSIHTMTLTASMQDPLGIPRCVRKVLESDQLQLVLIDDADDLDESPELIDLVTTRRANIRVVATARRDVKASYHHWVRKLCRSRTGIWLQPGPGLDGDLWNTPMPRHLPTGLPVGRGLLIADGRTEMFQAVSTHMEPSGEGRSGDVVDP